MKVCAESKKVIASVAWVFIAALEKEETQLQATASKSVTV